MLVVLGIVAVVVVVIGMIVAARMARTQSDEEAAPASRPGDFVAPVSSGGYRFRAPDETQEDFKARVEKENADDGHPKGG
jgi:hypothetical protein